MRTAGLSVGNRLVAIGMLAVLAAATMGIAWLMRRRATRRWQATGSPTDPHPQPLSHAATVDKSTVGAWERGAGLTRDIALGGAVVAIAAWR